MLSGLGNCNRDAAGSCMVLNFDLRSLKIGYFYATNLFQVKKSLLKPGQNKKYPTCVGMLVFESCFLQQGVD